MEVPAERTTNEQTSEGVEIADVALRVRRVGGVRRQADGGGDRDLELLPGGAGGEFGNDQEAGGVDHQCMEMAAKRAINDRAKNEDQEVQTELMEHSANDPRQK